MSSSKKSKLPEPVKAKSRDKSVEKVKKEKESKLPRSKSRDAKKLREDRERSSSKSKSEKTTEKKDKERSSSKYSKEKESRKSRREKSPERPPPAELKRTESKKEKETSKAEPKRPPTPPQEIEASEEYADDFEDYDDDFEEDSDEDTRKVSPPVQQSQPSSTPQLDTEEHSDTNESVRSSKENRSELAQDYKMDDLPKESYGEVEEEPIDKMKSDAQAETPMMRRLQSRQGGRRAEPVRLQPQNTRVLSASERKIHFNTTATTVSSAAVSESNVRYRMLRQLIGNLERKSTVLIAHPPVKDYDFYLEMFGNSGKAQIFTQTGEDNVTEEMQTEQEETMTKWTQQPAQDEIGWGTEGGGVKYGHDDDADLALFRGPTAAQTEALHKFMDVAAGVMFELLASTRYTSDYFSMQNKSKHSFSAGFNNFQLVPTANESKITAITRSKTDEYSFLCAFHVRKSNHESIVSRSLLVEYPLDRNAPPQRLFLAQSIANSVSYSDDGTMLFAGLQDGSIVAWDLFESTSVFDHRLPWLDSKDGIAFREPSFDTSFMSSIIHDDRTLAIVSVHVVSSDGGGIFQLCALDEHGTISTWTVGREAKPSGSSGCRPGSRLLLTLSSIVRPDSTVLRASTSDYIMANCMAASPDDPMQLLIGTDVGFIASVSRGKSSGYNGPRLYKSPMHVYGEVLCIQFSPFESKILATGLSTGSISIHRAGQVGALVILTPPKSSRAPVSLIEWSPICPTVFYTMHESGHLLTWNLSIGKAPQAINDLNAERSYQPVCSHAWHEKAKESTGIAYLALGLADGSVQVHALEPVKSTSTQSLTGILRRMEAGL